LARIRRTQGRKGEVFAELLTDFPQKFAGRRQLWLLPADSHASAPVPESGAPNPPALTARAAELTNDWLHKGGIVLHFSGIDSISAAEALKGLIVAIPRAQRVQLPDDEVYINDLIGCTLVDVGRAVPGILGEIEDVDRSAGPAPLLVLRGPRGETLIPFAKSYIRRIDLAARRIEMALPEGLIDLNLADEA
jgi:16S rRNA processing protein RimM